MSTVYQILLAIMQNKISVTGSKSCRLGLKKSSVKKQKISYNDFKAIRIFMNNYDFT